MARGLGLACELTAPEFKMALSPLQWIIHGAQTHALQPQLARQKLDIDTLALSTAPPHPGRNQIISHPRIPRSPAKGS